MPTCSVVIPAYNNERTIDPVLAALFSQTIPAPWAVEVIVVDDGSRDATASLARVAVQPPRWQLHVLPLPHHGAAAARNQGIAQATGTVILLLGADIVLRPQALVAHLEFHERYPSEVHAALGHILWDPSLKPSPLMEWLNHGGPQNSYDELLAHETADPTRFFYGSHISVKRALLQRELFATTFQGYGWEDLEVGRRLQRRGLVLHPLWAARGLHRHNYTVADVCRRQAKAGAALMHYQALHPQLPLAPPPRPRQVLKYVVGHYSGFIWLLVQLVRWRHNTSFPRIYAVITQFCMWRGILGARLA